MFQTPAPRSMLAALCVVGVILSPVLVGFAPLLGDPELLYQPIKAELARALSAGRLPYWSDRFGLGVPLVAESHAAAFYPLNWLFYRLWDVSTAYRLTLWLHSLALVATTFAYGRTLGLGPGGAALAAVSFTLCGFQAVHAKHEPFYHAMPYLPLCLLLADRYAKTGRVSWLAGLALAWGLQISLGHFQIQMWTGGLALLTGCWRVMVVSVGSARKLGRALGLVAALSWGVAIAWIQLRLTWEMTGVAGFVRPAHFLAYYLFPPAHVAQFALPEVFLGSSTSGAGTYWERQGSDPGEASAYVGVVPLVLAFVGMVAARGDRSLSPWRLIVPLTLALATMPAWWPDGYFALLQLPGLGWFRAPARYTLLTSLGLALLAGRGLDRTLPARRFWGGIALAILGGALAWSWSVHWASRADFRASQGEGTFAMRFGTAGVVWILGIGAIIGWRRRLLPPWVPIGVALLELAGLYFLGPVRWQWTIRLPEASPVLRRLAGLPDAGLVAGRLAGLPVDAGVTVAFPYLGLTAPPPNYLLYSATLPPGRNTASERRWHRRFGVSFGVWGSRDNVGGTQVLAEIADPALDRVVSGALGLKNGGLGPWKLVRMPAPFPSAWIARHIREAPDWPRLYSGITAPDTTADQAWILSEDVRPPLPNPLAREATIKLWDKRTAIVEHDGACILVMRRTFYPGWVYRINDGPAQPVLKVDGGLQGVPLAGAGTTRIAFSYRPTGFKNSAAVTLAALAAAIAVCGVAGWSAANSRTADPAPLARDRRIE